MKSSLIDKIDEEILKSSEIALGSCVPDFPVEELQSSLREIFSDKELEFHFGKTRWLPRQEYMKGIGEPKIIIPMAIPKLSGDLIWVISVKDAKHITNLIKDENGLAISLQDEVIIKEMLKFQLLRTIRSIEGLQFLDFSPVLKEEHNFESSSYCVDIHMTFDQHSLLSRLIISRSLAEKGQSHFDDISPQQKIEKLKNIPISLSLLCGSVKLTKEELSSLKEGDFIIGDNISYNPTSGKGWLTLNVSNSPFFQVKLKNGALRIIDLIVTKDSYG